MKKNIVFILLLISIYSCQCDNKLSRAELQSIKGYWSYTNLDSVVDASHTLRDVLQYYNDSILGIQFFCNMDSLLKHDTLYCCEDWYDVDSQFAFYEKEKVNDCTFLYIHEDSNKFVCINDSSFDRTICFYTENGEKRLKYDITKNGKLLHSYKFCNYSNKKESNIGRTIKEKHFCANEVRLDFVIADIICGFYKRKYHVFKFNEAGRQKDMGIYPCEKIIADVAQPISLKCLDVVYINISGNEGFRGTPYYVYYKEGSYYLYKDEISANESYKNNKPYGGFMYRLDVV